MRKRHSRNSSRDVVVPPDNLDEGVAALLPKMKRMRLRPSIGQLRLRREVDDVQGLPPQVHLRIEPELLRAAVTLCCGGTGGFGAAEVMLEISFPPQYPHKAPQVAQVAPERHLPGWQYEGRLVLLMRLMEKCWSPAMGVRDIVKDLLELLAQQDSSNGRQVPQGPGVFQGLEPQCLDVEMV